MEEKKSMEWKRRSEYSLNNHKVVMGRKASKAELERTRSIDCDEEKKLREREVENMQETRREKPREKTAELPFKMKAISEPTLRKSQSFEMPYTRTSRSSTLTKSEFSI